MSEYMSVDGAGLPRESKLMDGRTDSPLYGMAKVMSLVGDH